VRAYAFKRKMFEVLKDAPISWTHFNGGESCALMPLRSVVTQDYMGRPFHELLFVHSNIHRMRILIS
jgi:hypothetical protein